MMSDRSIFGLIDPRDHRVFHVGTLDRNVGLNEHVADVVANAMAGRTSPTDQRVRAILAADFEAPHAVILQADASEADLATWTRTLQEAGNALTNGSS
jgi:hypothetical protein